MLDEKIMIIASTAILVLVVMLLVLFAYFYQKRIFEREAELSRISEMLKKTELKIAYALLEGQQQERLRVARDLHDHLGAVLSTAQVYTDLLMQRNKGDDTAELTHKLGGVISSSLENVRRISHDLENPSLHLMGLQAAIDQICDSISSAFQIEIHRFYSLQGVLDYKLSADVYAIIQELIHNSIKHGKASVIRIELSSFNENNLSIIYEDNGLGFDTSQYTDGLGLKNLQTRIEKYNGTVTIESAIGKGITVIAEIEDGRQTV
jgi:hypothetical protein